MPAQNSSRINPGKIAAEMTGIVFAVLLALWLEGLREDAELQEIADELSKRIVVEIEINRAELIGAMADNDAVLTILVPLAALDVAKFEDIQGLTYFTAGNTTDSAWKSAQMTNATRLMSLDELTTIADVYETQDYYRDYNQNFMRGIATVFVGFQDDESRQSALRILITNISVSNFIGDQLLVKYDAFLGIEPTEDAEATDAEATDAE